MVSDEIPTHLNKKGIAEWLGSVISNLNSKSY